MRALELKPTEAQVAGGRGRQGGAARARLQGPSPRRHLRAGHRRRGRAVEVALRLPEEPRQRPPRPPGARVAAGPGGAARRLRRRAAERVGTFPAGAKGVRGAAAGLDVGHGSEFRVVDPEGAPGADGRKLPRRKGLVRPRRHARPRADRWRGGRGEAEPAAHRAGLRGHREDPGALRRVWVFRHVIPRVGVGRSRAGRARWWRPSRGGATGRPTCTSSSGRCSQAGTAWRT